MARTRKIWQPFEIEILKQSYADLPTKDIAEILGRSMASVQHQAYKMELKKSQYYQKYLSHRFKGDEGRAYRFQKGHLPVNTLYDGAIALRHGHKKRGGKPYYWIRISQNNWKHLHVHLWEQEKGGIPPKNIVAFKDGNTMNCVIDNLELITREENMRRNSIHNYPSELKSLMRLNSKLNKAITNATKQNR